MQHSSKVVPVSRLSELIQGKFTRLNSPVLSLNFVFIRIKFVLTPKSGVFLGGSCVAAIAAVGSVFELSSGTPQLGMLATGIILALSVPLVVIFFFAAVRDAKANQ